MKLVMTLLVRDESDIIDAHLAFHLNTGVDFVIATDHRSDDGTTQILQRYAREGYLRLMSEDAVRIQQSEVVTRMARLAASDHDADWVINSDADEFWWPRATTFKEALDAVPSSYGVVYAPMSYFLPRRGTGPFYDTMTVRLSQSAPINNPLSRYRPTVKAAHRASSRVVVRRGNHAADHSGLPLNAWHPLEVLHFPDRTPEQCARKYANTVAAWPSTGREPGAFVLAAQNAIERAGADNHFDSLAVSDEDVAAGGGKVLEIDTRLRDAFQRLRAPTGDRYFRPDELPAPLALPQPSALDDVRHAVEVAVLNEAELIRIHRGADDLNLRIQALERRPSARVLRRLLSTRR